MFKGIMRRSFPLLILLLTLAIPVSLDAQVRRITTDDAPSFIWADGSHNQIHTFTAGVDRNFNGVFEPDSGDVAPRWFVIDGASETIIDSVTFDGFFNDFPIRPSIDSKGRRVFLPQLGRIRMFNLDTRALMRDTVINADASAVTYDTLVSRLLFSIRPGFTRPGIIGCVDGTSFHLLFSSVSGVSPGMTAYAYGRADSTIEYYTVCEGTGGPDATLTYNAYNLDLFSAVNDRALGAGAVAMTTTPSLVILAFNGTPAIRMLDAGTHRELPFSPIATGTHKPVSIAVDSTGAILVGTADGRLLFIDTTTGSIIDSMALGGQVMAIAVGRNSIAFAALSAGRDSTVVAIDLTGRTEIADAAIGGTPVGLLVDPKGDAHVFANTADSAIWVRYDSLLAHQSGSRSFGGRLYVPAQVAYSTSTDQILLAPGGQVLAFSNTDSAAQPVVFTDEEVNGGALAGVTSAGDHILVTELSADSSSNVPGYIQVLSQEGEMEGFFATGPRPIAVAGTITQPSRAKSFCAFDRGSRRGSRSLLTFYQFAPSIFAPDDTLGKSANHIVVVEQAGVTMTGSHEIVEVGLDDWATAGRYSTGTAGFNGPREALLLDDRNVAVSTYNGDIRILTESPGGYRIFETGGKAEGMGYLPALKKLFVAIPFAPDYSADTVVVVFDTEELVASIDRMSPLASRTTLDQNIPNPAGDRTAVSFSIDSPDHVALDLFTADGRQVARLFEQSLEGGTYSIEVKTGELAPGAYIYTLKTRRGVISRTMTITR